MKTKNKITSIIFIALIFILASCGGDSRFRGEDGDVMEESAPVDKADFTDSESSVEMKKETDATKDVEIDVVDPGEPNQQQSGLLTAGEWNDLDNWDFWLGLMQNKEWSDKQKHWNFYLTDRIPVTVKNKTGKLLNDISISLLSSSDNELWNAKTDVFGKAVLFASVFDQQAIGMKIVITDSKGKTTDFNSFNVNDENTLVINDTPELSNNLDIMLVVDATGSMGDELEFLKNELKDIIEEAETKTPELQSRVGMVFYRDKGDQYLNRNFPFESDIEKVAENISKQKAGGGGDFEEAVEVALDEAVNNFSWNENARARLMFVILDAPPHHTNENLNRIQSSIINAAKKGIKLIPIAASGIDKNTEFLMRFMAITTNGTYVFLTDDSGIGESHLVPTTGKYEVEFLNDLILRLIMKYTGSVEV